MTPTQNTPRRTFFTFPVSNLVYFKKQLLYWANRFDACCFLDNNNYSYGYHSYECIVGAGTYKHISATAGSAFQELRRFSDEANDWIFGHFGYDLKNELEDVNSNHPDGIQFPDLFFFIPETIVLIKGSEISIGSISSDAVAILRQIQSTSILEGSVSAAAIQGRFNPSEYIDTVRSLQSHIQRGDCYEINFCQEFYADTVLNPVHCYHLLSGLSPNPFGAYYKIENRFLCCASPERYLRKEGNKVISQPIKGTSPRNRDDPEEDTKNKTWLHLSTKDRSENIMVVDLVRNDLSRICSEGTVRVDELCEIYSFPQVYQMISTVSGIIDADLHWVDAIRATFPMGSMTGAPKKKVMDLIEKYERTKRGIFSGALGYVSPPGDFDFNVVIRSILYNHTNKYVSYQVGSGITVYSDPRAELEECMLKAAAIKKVLF